MRKIICPVDFSEASFNAIEFAAKIGAKHQSHLTLLYVFTDEEHSILLSEGRPLSLEEWKQEVELKLSKLIKEVNESAGMKGLAHCGFETAQGNLTKAIIKRADNVADNLIVMGTNGASDVTETYVGSNTVNVIEKADCPVLCIPERAQYHKLKKIVYASNYQEEDKKALNQLAVFARPFNAEINVLHVSHKDKLIETAIYEDFKKEVSNSVNYPFLKYTHYIYEDEVNRGLDEYMVQENGGLLVLLTKHKNLFDKIFKRSLSQRMSYFVDYPLLLFKMKEEKLI